MILKNSGTELIRLNNVNLKINPVDILSIQKRRLITEEFIRENSNYVYMGNYGEANFKIILQFDINSVLSEFSTPDRPSDFIQLLAQINNYPFIFVKSERVTSYLTSHIKHGPEGELLFGIKSFELRTDSEAQNIMTLTLHLTYFNHAPYAKELTFFEAKADRTQLERTKILKGKPNIEYTERETHTLIGNELFHRYFTADYAAIISRLDKYFNEEDKYPMSKVALRYPVFVNEEPEEGDYEEIKFSEVTEDNKVIKRTAYTLWPDLKNSRNINSSAAPVTSLAIVRNNNFASHSMTAWAYPTLQYMGKGSTNVVLTIAQESNSGTTLEYIKTCLAKLDSNHRKYAQYAQYNVLKLDHIMFDLIPVFGLVLDREEIGASSDFQDVDRAVFVFAEKNIKSLIERKRPKPSGFRRDNQDMDHIIDIMTRMEAGILGERNRTENKQCSRSYSPKLGVLDNYRTMRIPNPLNATILKEIEKQHGLPVNTLYNVMWKESKGNARSVSSSGKVGAFQFDPNTAARFKLEDSTDPIASASAAAEYLAWLRNRYDGDMNMALAGYNLGEVGIGRAIQELADDDKEATWQNVAEVIPKNTQDYVSAVTEGMTADANNEKASRQRCSGKWDLGQADKILSNLSDKLNGTESAIFKIYEPGSLGPRTVGVPTNDMRKISSSLKFYKELRKDQANRQEAFGTATRDIQDAFLKLLRESSRGNKFIKSYMADYSRFLYENHDQIINSFEDEAYSDLSLGSRIFEAGPAIGEDGKTADDPRQINPFFFMKAGAYYTPKILERSYNLTAGQLRTNAGDISAAITKAIINDTSGEKGKIESIGRVGAIYSEEDIMNSRLQEVKVSKAINDLADQIDKTSIETARGDYPLDMETQGPNAERLQAAIHFERSAESLKRGMNQAFPVIKVYLVEGDEDSLASNFRNVKHEYYELPGVVSARVIHQNDDSPVDVMHIKIANPGSIYTDSSVLMDEFYPKKNWKNIDTNFENSIPLDRIFIRPGNRLHVKAGYSNDINNLETMFNGIVTDVSGEMTLDIISESFGRELIAYPHGDDPSESNFTLGSDTFEVVANFVYSPELEHFGNIKFFSSLADIEGKGRQELTFNNLLKYHGSSALFVNIYTSNVVQDGYDYGTNLFNFFSLFGGMQIMPHFPIYKTTPWEGLKEMEFRHPGSLTRANNYGDRHTIFYGIKEQLYVYRDTHYAIQASNDERLYNTFRRQRLRPASDFHIFTSDNNIISNGLRVTSDFNTVVSVRYYDDVDDIKNQDYDWYDMKVDDNLKPMAHRLGRLEMAGTHGKYPAFSYGSTYLRKEVEKMYDGRILLIGNPSVKSGDYAVIDDAVRGMNGIIKIRECIQHFDIHNGFVTEIVPGLYAESSHIDYSMLFSKLYMAYMPAITIARAVSSEDNQKMINMSLMLDLVGSSNNPLDPNNNKFLSQEFWAAAGLGGSVFLAGQLAALSAVKSTGISVAGVVNSTTLAAAKTSSFVGSKLPVIGKIASSIGSSGAAAFKTMRTGLQKALANSRIASVSIHPSVAKWGLKLARMATPVGIAGTLLYVFVSEYSDEISKTRQPIRMFPVQVNNKQYIGGIWGYREGTFWEDVNANVSTNLDSAGILWDHVWDAF